LRIPLDAIAKAYSFAVCSAFDHRRRMLATLRNHGFFPVQHLRSSRMVDVAFYANRNSRLLLDICLLSHEHMSDQWVLGHRSVAEVGGLELELLLSHLALQNVNEICVLKTLDFDVH
jgi:hypothetical protein